MAKVTGAHEKLYSAEFQQAQNQRWGITNKEKSIEVVKWKTHMESTTQTRSTSPKSGKSQKKTALI